MRRSVVTATAVAVSMSVFRRAAAVTSDRFAEP